MYPRRCPLLAAFLICLNAQPALGCSVVFKLLCSFRSLRLRAHRQNAIDPRI
jgi:hypothetical protein